jgi:2Fe-2S ferredoxin
MVKIVFVRPDGAAAEVDAAPGESVMFAALTSGIDGILGECGGGAVCGTCHVYVDPRAAHLFAPADDTEDDLLDYVAAGRGPTSRLGCRLVLAGQHDGVVLRLPDRQ